MSYVPPRPPVRMLVTVAVGKHEEFLAITRPSYESFADRHGYELRAQTNDPAPARANKMWSKIAYIRDLLPDCDELLWIDSDAAIVDTSRDIALDVPRRRFLGLVEHHYRGQHVPNTGVMFIRSGARADRFFREMWDMTEYLDHGWGDNGAALEMFGYRFDAGAEPMVCQPGRRTKWLRKVHLLPIEWNSVAEDMATTPRIVHVTGSFSHEERLELLRTVLA